VADGVSVALGQQLTEGSVNPHDLLHLKGPSDVLLYIVAQVQDVYRSQGVDINDKHIEVISRQMLRKVTVLEPGDTDFLPGQLVERLAFEQTNEQLMADGAEPGVGTPVLLGITKASLATDSYLSAASFQETTRVLTDAAIAGKEDQLLGLKENVIIGKLIPAATGMKRYRSVKLTYKGQSAEWEGVEEGPLPDFAPEELKELESLLPGPSVDEGISADEAAAFFADLESGGAETQVDVARFDGTVFEPEIAKADDGGGISFDEAVPSAAAPGMSLMPLDELGLSTRVGHQVRRGRRDHRLRSRTYSRSELLDVPGHRGEGGPGARGASCRARGDDHRVERRRNGECLRRGVPTGRPAACVRCGSRSGGDRYARVRGV
jgi:hypothetical protein